MRKLIANDSSPYVKEEKNIDVFTFIIHITAIIFSALNMLVNYQKGLTESICFDAFIITAIVIAMIVYFKHKKFVLGAYISVLGTTIGVSGALYFEGRLSFNFLYYFAIILSIPFLIKRNNYFIRDNFILFITVSVIATIAIFIAPVYPKYAFVTADDIYFKMILNSTISLLITVMLMVFAVYVSRDYFISFLKDKKFAVKEKDKRLIALTSLGHELRTQITSINGITQLISEQKTEPKINRELIKKYALILDNCNDQMLNIVNDVLDIHKIESGKFELLEKPENLNLLLSSIASEFNLLADNKGLNFKREITPEITNLNIDFDKMRLAQIFKNLLSNAIKYTDTGEINLKVELIEETDTKASVLFKVEDTGIGISETDYSKIFESFQQIKSESADIYGGTGLGLSLTKTILDKMQSKIIIERNVDKGSIFSFTIDFNKTTQEHLRKNIENIINNPCCLKDKKILVADDNKVTLLYADTLLKKHKAKTYLAKDGLEAVEIAKTHKEIDIILLDLEMPKLSGLKAIEQIKALNPNQTVIAFTANTPNEALLKKLNRYGFDDFITKPFKKETLIKAIFLNCKEDNKNIDKAIVLNE
tara:strand:+ start:13839 stop:15620 length:1782 start_codon:yes stop_codon:yes gene_type:complete